MIKLQNQLSYNTIQQEGKKFMINLHSSFVFYLFSTTKKYSVKVKIAEYWCQDREKMIYNMRKFLCRLLSTEWTARWKVLSNYDELAHFVKYFLLVVVKRINSNNTWEAYWWVFIERLLHKRKFVMPVWKFYSRYLWRRDNDASCSTFYQTNNINDVN